ncbi:unnamed protein product [Cyprideis torosa]|uniref:Uncharacterized protein n=1 Tax=Cyprideis torosa TaxID=163714 RepID=A0A7R8W8J4_9CRUS|nr:unnamed protein product [Cyprideis torosa]CAG0883889.1 unnamed protein product [Cyprideis torosa]
MNSRGNLQRTRSDLPHGLIMSPAVSSNTSLRRKSYKLIKESPEAHEVSGAGPLKRARFNPLTPSELSPFASPRRFVVKGLSSASSRCSSHISAATEAVLVSFSALSDTLTNSSRVSSSRRESLLESFNEVTDALSSRSPVRSRGGQDPADIDTRPRGGRAYIFTPKGSGPSSQQFHFDPPIPSRGTQCRFDSPLPVAAEQPPQVFQFDPPIPRK